MKKKIVVVLSLFCFLLVGFALNTPKAVAMSWDQLVEAGKKEGKVMIYGSGSPAVRKELSSAFTPKYGIELEFLYIGRGGALAAKIKQERSAGLYLPDAIISGNTTATNLLKPVNAIDPIEPLLVLPDVKDPKMWIEGFYFIDKDKMMKPLRANFNRFVVRNTELVKEGELKSYKDLINPKWKGKIIMGDPARPGTGNGFVGFLNAVWGRAETTEYLKKLAALDPVLTKEIRMPVEWVARGKKALAVAPRIESVPEFLKNKSPIAPVRMIEGGTLAPGTGNIFVCNKRPHPNATAVFVNWLLTKEGMTAFSRGDGHPTGRKDVPTDFIEPIFMQQPGDIPNVDPEEAYKIRKELQILCKKIFAAQLKKK